MMEKTASTISADPPLIRVNEMSALTFVIRNNSTSTIATATMKVPANLVVDESTLPAGVTYDPDARWLRKQAALGAHEAVSFTVDVLATAIYKKMTVFEIAELDLNPVIALPPGHGCRVVDARIRVRPAHTINRPTTSSV